MHATAHNQQPERHVQLWLVWIIAADPQRRRIHARRQPGGVERDHHLRLTRRRKCTASERLAQPASRRDLNQAPIKVGIPNVADCQRPGDRVTTVVSTMGIFKKPVGKGELRLVACLPAPALSGLEDRVKRVQDNCGWTIGLVDTVEDIPTPTPDELKLLRQLASPR